MKRIIDNNILLEELCKKNIINTLSAGSLFIKAFVNNEELTIVLKTKIINKRNYSIEQRKSTIEHYLHQIIINNHKITNKLPKITFKVFDQKPFKNVDELTTIHDFINLINIYQQKLTITFFENTIYGHYYDDKQRKTFFYILDVKSIKYYKVIKHLNI